MPGERASEENIRRETFGNNTFEFFVWRNFSRKSLPRTSHSQSNFWKQYFRKKYWRRNFWRKSVAKSATMQKRGQKCDQRCDQKCAKVGRCPWDDMRRRIDGSKCMTAATYGMADTIADERTESRRGTRRQPTQDIQRNTCKLPGSQVMVDTRPEKTAERTKRRKQHTNEEQQRRNGTTTK